MPYWVIFTYRFTKDFLLTVLTLVEDEKITIFVNTIELFYRATAFTFREALQQLILYGFV
jgi:hypothetical protein